MPDLAGRLDRRLRKHLREWPRPMVAVFNSYWHRPAAARRRRPSRGGGERSWTLVPRWVWAAWALDGDRAVLDDILWAQYCLFLFVRIHDDLLDGQATDPALLLLADDLLVESELVFTARVPAARFRILLHEYLRTTLRAIVEVDVRERSAGRMTVANADLYAQVGAIFKAGTAAACLACGRGAMLRSLGRFLDHLAIASQIFDDLFDVQEDLDRGRFNVAANALGVARAGRRTAPARLARAVLVDDAVGRLLETADDHLDRAGAAIAPASLPRAARSVRDLRRELTRLQHALYHARVKAIFHGAGMPGLRSV